MPGRWPRAPEGASRAKQREAGPDNVIYQAVEVGLHLRQQQVAVAQRGTRDKWDVLRRAAEEALCPRHYQQQVAVVRETSSIIILAQQEEGGQKRAILQELLPLPSWDLRYSLARPEKVCLPGVPRPRQGDLARKPPQRSSHPQGGSLIFFRDPAPPSLARRVSTAGRSSARHQPAV